MIALPLAGLLLGAAGPQDRLANFRERVLATHNAERVRIGVPPLVWSDALASNASQYAVHLSRLPVLEHDASLDVEGENLWRGTKGAYSPEDMVTLWIDERRVFVNKPFPEVSTTGDIEDVGHYTQLIWRSTALVGCAVADAGEDEVMVCRYMEGGNVMTEMTY
ncbi:SCP-like extracellular [Rhizorhabdus dicambivorans]|uniref:SCP-like extracellular n=2 Tax=Rhizorhabdus dicambivorans TaxID=1850238 RepID=A0A2A4FVQ0_9SPHN|nr:SCP-like extracellular [Rhizorhabdus dicambivorans]PCE42269.1 SCP-like extracellular [Rhizorhabdus dicambivorans]